LCLKRWPGWPMISCRYLSFLLKALELYERVDCTKFWVFFSVIYGWALSEFKCCWDLHLYEICAYVEILLVEAFRFSWWQRQPNLNQLGGNVVVTYSGLTHLQHWHQCTYLAFCSYKLQWQ
jgi:hypothetical protein